MELVSPPAQTPGPAGPGGDGQAAADALADAHYENFPVLTFVPRRMRPHFANLYAFCRRVDDIGDEGDDTPAQRMARLDEFAAQLDLAYLGTPTDRRFRALQGTINAFQLEREQFERLIVANRMDQGPGRFETYADLLHYCDHSATPVGRLVLQLYGHRDAERVRRSDATCTALQLANFWQDVAVDWTKQRIYLPLEDLAHFGYTEEQLATGEVNGAWRALMRFEVARARGLFTAGLPLRDQVEGRLRLVLAAFSRGGMAILDAIEAARYDVFRHRPTNTKRLFIGQAIREAARLTFVSPLWWTR